MAILLGLLAAVAYGSADFIGGFATKRSSAFAVTVVSQAAGLIVLIACLPFLSAHATPADFAWGAGAGVCGGLGIALLYQALSIGRMGVVSPITAVLSAAFPVIVGVARGEALGSVRAIGVGVALLAVVLISMSNEPDGSHERKLAGVREAFASGLLLGAFYIFIGNTHQSAGLFNLLAARTSSIIVLCGLAFALRASLVPAKGSWLAIIVAGTLDMAANAMFVLATYSGYLSIAAVLTSLYPAATVLLAFVVIKERLRPIQVMGGALAIAGVVAIAL